VHGWFLSWLWCVARCWQPTPTGRHRLTRAGPSLDNAITHELITVTTDAYINSASVGQLPAPVGRVGLAGFRSPSFWTTLAISAVGWCKTPPPP